MPQNEIGWLLIIGAIFFLIGLLGGGIEISVVKIPPISKYPRVTFSIIGALFLFLAIFQILNPAIPQSQGPNEGISSTVIVPTGTPALPPTLIPSTPTHELTQTASPTSPSAVEIFFSDDFETIRGMWDTGDSRDDYAVEKKMILNGKYMWEISALAPLAKSVMPKALIVSNFDLQAELRLVSGPENTSYGLIFRSSEHGEYVFFINNQGLFTVGFYDKESKTWQYPIPWERSDSIGKNKTNALRVVAEGSNIEVYINDERVGSISDSSSNSGKAGIGVWLFAKGDNAILEADNYNLAELQE